MNKDRELSIAEENLQTYMRQAISAIEQILKTAKIEYENYAKTGEGINNAANHLAKDIMWFIPNRCPDLLIYAQRVTDEYEKKAK